MEEGDFPSSRASPVTLVTMVTDAVGVTESELSAPLAALESPGDAKPLIGGDDSLVVKRGPSPAMNGDESPITGSHQSPTMDGDASMLMAGHMPTSQLKRRSDAGSTLLSPEPSRAKSAPNQQPSALLSVR